MFPGGSCVNLHDQARASWVGSVLLQIDPAQPLSTAGEELDDVDHDLFI